MAGEQLRNPCGCSVPGIVQPGCSTVSTCYRTIELISTVHYCKGHYWPHEYYSTVLH